MTLLRYLANLGYGSRRDVQALFSRRRVTRADGVVLRADDSLADDRIAHDDIRVDGLVLDPPPASVVLLHKPVGHVCSTEDASNPVVYDLLPPRFRARSPIMAPVGRLDRDTSGLLLVTDDGALNHRLTSPRSHQPKVYVATLADDLRGDEAGLFASGSLRLRAEPTPLEPATLVPVALRVARIVLTEGRYHQVRRMFAAVGHHVETLQRVAMGPIELGDLPSGAWRLLDSHEIAALNARESLSAP